MQGYNARQCTHHAIITYWLPHFVMVRKDKPTLHTSYRKTAITSLLIGLIITTGTLSVLRPILNQNHTAMAQGQQGQQPQLGNV